VQAFELNAVDYLLKPVRAERLATALQKVQQNRPMLPDILATLPQGPRTHLSCHERGRLLLIPIGDVRYLKADLKYVTARTPEREYLLDESLTHLEQEFSERLFACIAACWWRRTPLPASNAAPRMMPKRSGKPCCWASPRSCPSAAGSGRWLNPMQNN
jgi:two-component system response regulator AlgR